MIFTKLILIFSLIFSQPAKADAVLEEMGEAFGQTFVTVVAQETLKWSATKAFESQAAGSAVGTAFAVYGVYNAAVAFDKADTDSQRYYAAAQGVAAVWMAVEPTTGLIVNLIVMAQMMMGASISADFAKKHQKIILEIQKIEKERLSINKEIFEREFALVKKFFVQIHLYSKATESLDANLETNCQDITKNSSIKKVMNCYSWFVERNYILKELLYVYGQLFSTAYSFVNLKNILEVNKIKEDDVKQKYADLVERLEVLKINEIVLTNFYRELLSTLVLVDYEASEAFSRARTFECTRGFVAYQSDLAELHSNFIKAKKDKSIELLFHLPSRFQYMKNQFDLGKGSICKFLVNKKEKLVNAIKSYEERLQVAIEGEYERLAL